MNIKKRTGKLILWAFMLTALLEITLFNFRHWESFLFPKLAQPQLTLGEGIEKIGEYEYQITDPDQAYVNLDGVSGHYKNLYLNIRSESGLTTNVSLTADDAANCMGLNLGDETIISTIPRSSYIYALGRRYFQKLSYGMFLLMSSFYFWGSGTLYLVYLGIVYSLPIISALLFGTFGLTLWILARKDGKLRKGYLFAGALSIALIIGCRPQLAIILFLAFPIFWKEIVEERVFFSKKGLVNTMMVIVPFLIIGFAMMGYNYARFHSPFDFGANYNLTSNDMAHRGFVFDRFFLGIFCYLLEPINLTAKFPFMHAVSTANDYLGFTSAEPMFGGFFIMNNLALASLFVFKMKKKLKEHKVYAFTVSCLAMGMIIMLCDIQMSGITQRYMSDFGGLIVLSAVMILFLLEEIAHAYKLQHVFCRAVAMLTGLGIFLNFLTILIPERYYSLVSTRQTLFYMLKYMMPFE